MSHNVWNEIISTGINRQNYLNKSSRKVTGTFYTGLELAEVMVNELFKQIDRDDIWNLKLLEPCVGVGNFVFTYLKHISTNYDLTVDQLKVLVNNIYVCDSDKEALNIYLSLLQKFVVEYFHFELNDSYINNLGESLIYDVQRDENEYINIERYFGDVKFDVVITNPPYKHLRAEKRHFNTIEEYEYYATKYKNIKKMSEKQFKFSQGGAANIYKYFVEDILTNYTHEKSVIGLLLPRT